RRPARRAGPPAAGIRALQAGRRGPRRPAPPGPRHQSGERVRARPGRGPAAPAGGPARDAAGAARRAAPRRAVHPARDQARRAQRAPADGRAAAAPAGRRLPPLRIAVRIARRPARGGGDLPRPARAGQGAPARHRAGTAAATGAGRPDLREVAGGRPPRHRCSAAVERVRRRRQRQRRRPGTLSRHDDRMHSDPIDSHPAPTLDQALVTRIVEAALLAAHQPLSLAQLHALFPLDEPAPDGSVEQALEQLREDCARRGVELVELASGFRYQVKADVHPWVARLWTERTTRYSRATLETLALIAYRQPITRGEIEQIRGVAVNSNIIKALEEREWIRVVGHRDVPGKPELLATTKAFLDYFGLKRLEDLPP